MNTVYKIGSKYFIVPNELRCMFNHLRDFSQMYYLIRNSTLLEFKVSEVILINLHLKILKNVKEILKEILIVF